MKNVMALITLLFSGISFADPICSILERRGSDFFPLYQISRTVGAPPLEFANQYGVNIKTFKYTISEVGGPDSAKSVVIDITDTNTGVHSGGTFLSGNGFGMTNSKDEQILISCSF